METTEQNYNDLKTTIEIVSLNTIKSVFDGKNSDYLQIVWKYLRTALTEAECLDEMRSKRQFKEAAYLVNYVIDSLRNSHRDKTFETTRDQNHFVIADHLVTETVRGDQSYLNATEFLLGIVDRLQPEKTYWFEEAFTFDVLVYDLRTIAHALKFTTEMSKLYVVPKQSVTI